eukprot:6707101-Alexandrium_andersonii.AAC.1
MGAPVKPGSGLGDMQGKEDIAGGEECEDQGVRLGVEDVHEKAQNVCWETRERGVFLGMRNA